MFTKRHEEQLAEIKALTYELGQRFDQVLGELEGIKKAQEELVKTATRTTDGPKPKVVGERTPNKKASGAKKGRGRRQAVAPAVGGDAKAAKRRRSAPAEAGDTQEPGRSRKDGKRSRKQRQPEPATAAGSGDD